MGKSKCDDNVDIDTENNDEEMKEEKEEKTTKEEVIQEEKGKEVVRSYPQKVSRSNIKRTKSFKIIPPNGVFRRSYVIDPQVVLIDVKIIKQVNKKPLYTQFLFFFFFFSFFISIFNSAKNL